MFIQIFFIFFLNVQFLIDIDLTNYFHPIIQRLILIKNSENYKNYINIIISSFH